MKTLFSVICGVTLSMVTLYAVDCNQQTLKDLVQDFLNNPEAARYQEKRAEHNFVRFEDDDTEEKEASHVHDYGLFYQQYLSKYYPKVYVIRLLFEQMSPEAMAQGLADIVSVFSDKTWFYFMDSKKRFNPAHYWEYIIDQCALLSEFFKDARIDTETKEIIASNRSTQELTKRPDGTARKTKNLYLYLKEHHKQAVADFYALCFDYVLKLFNEGILLKDIKSVYRYETELEAIIAKLRNTMYESEYQESMKTCKELIELLKEKIGLNEMDLIDDFFGDDEIVKYLAKSSLNLK